MNAAPRKGTRVRKGNATGGTSGWRDGEWSRCGFGVSLWVNAYNLIVRRLTIEFEIINQCVASDEL
jgi:hypothetical protein